MTEKTTREKAIEAGAKVPADKAIKAEAKGESIAVNVRGFDLVIDKDALDDYEALEQFRSGAPGLMLGILTGDQKGAVIESLRDGGRVRLSSVAEFVKDILEAVNQGKS